MRKLRATGRAKNGYWATEVEVSGLIAVAWTRLAQGKADEAEERMRQAADLEGKNDKHIVTPGRILPARELLGDMLLEMKRPADALKEYEASQRAGPAVSAACTARRRRRSRRGTRRRPSGITRNWSRWPARATHGPSSPRRRSVVDERGEI